MSDILSRIETLERLAVRVGELATLSRDIVGQSAQNAAMFRMSVGADGASSRITITIVLNIVDGLAGNGQYRVKNTLITLEEVAGVTDSSYATVTGETVTGTTDATGSLSISLKLGSSYRGSYAGSNRTFNSWWVANGTDAPGYYFVQNLPYFWVQGGLGSTFYAKNAATRSGPAQTNGDVFPPSEIVASYAPFYVWSETGICLPATLNATDQFGTYVITHTTSGSTWDNATRQATAVASGTNAACGAVATVNPRVTLVITQDTSVSSIHMSYTGACTSGANIARPATYPTGVIRSISAGNGSGTPYTLNWTFDFSASSAGGGAIFGTGSTTVTVVE